MVQGYNPEPASDDSDEHDALVLSRFKPRAQSWMRSLSMTLVLVVLAMVVVYSRYGVANMVGGQLVQRDVHVVKEGWLLKRGEYIKNWRPRYFMLMSDGSFLGYKDTPSTSPGPPLNNFNVVVHQVMKYNKPKPNTWVLRCFQLTTLVERTYSAETPELQDEWIEALRAVSASLSSRWETPSASTTGTRLDDYKLLKVITKSKFSTTMLARVKETGKPVKVTRFQDFDYSEGLMPAPACPFVSGFIATFQDSEERLVVVEEYGDEIFFKNSVTKTFSEERSRFYAAEIILALKCYEQRIIYPAFRLEELSLDPDGHILISEAQPQAMSQGITCRSSPEYLAPEEIKGDEVGPATNSWNLGVVIYSLLCGTFPFENREHGVLMDLIQFEEVRFPSFLSESAKSFLSGLLEKDPAKRLGGGRYGSLDVMNHEFFQSVDWDDILLRKRPPPE